jgi:hypothetical protein
MNWVWDMPCFGDVHFLYKLALHRRGVWAQLALGGGPSYQGLELEWELEYTRSTSNC